MAETIEDKITKLEAHKKAIEEKIAECQKALERSKKPKLAIPFVPKEGDEYWYYNTLLLNCHNKTNENGLGDEIQIQIGNSFRTEEEAKVAYEKRCAETELLMLCDGLEKDQCFVPYFDDKERCIVYWNWHKTCPYRFASKESCQAAINKLGERKLRLVFNIPLRED